jgi:hypothetical protein
MQNIPDDRKIDQMATKYVHHLRLQDPPKFTQIGIIDFKKCHLATLLTMPMTPTLPRKPFYPRLSPISMTLP